MVHLVLFEVVNSPPDTSNTGAGQRSSTKVALLLLVWQVGVLHKHQVVAPSVVRAYEVFGMDAG